MLTIFSCLVHMANLLFLLLHFLGLSENALYRIGFRADPQIVSLDNFSV